MKKILVIIILILVTLMLAKNIIAQTLIVNGIKAITGLQVKAGTVNIGALKTFLGLNNLKILNPANFSDKIMADLPEIYVDYNLGDFFKGKAHLEELRIHLRELTVIKNQMNQVNIQSLSALLPKSGGKTPEIKIDSLNLKIGKVIFKDYAQDKAQVREFDINFNESFKNINDPKALVGLILVKALSRTTIPSLADINWDTLKLQAQEALKQRIDATIQPFKEKAEEAVRSLEEQIGGILE